MLKVLLVDDDDFTNEMFARMLKSRGSVEVEIRTSGREALLYLEKCKLQNSFPDVIFVDLSMPGMDGFTFIEKCEKRFPNVTHEVNIYILTNSILKKDKDKASRFKSVRDFYNKPVTSKIIHEILPC